MPETAQPEVVPPSPQSAVATPPKKDQEDLNIEVYERVFLKCMGAAARVIKHRHGTETTEEAKDRQVKIAAAIFDRFYSDQASMKSGKLQAEAMIQGMTQVLEGRR